ncbi:uncharacterized protein GVI51_B02145 [Nakaseomyces glabratus]|uniref:Small ribosomal subunit protein mS33 n=2 Tax=Candida glabrata TaxID=5478 RepID=Q6FXF9_CANGA|nr:mitochondrial 37S ribosomal protein RSM27 [Nakaseomyces glabratus]KAH7590973.1 Mitochondrial ribosomal subunit S27 [Nakaseomyces glabratus]KAH7591627.1 Mitochondrial ribosomal subunit S27 [Nakaseomyces glabratus]KAH7598222.1 Mitochondrial ribosomal subunit S27 [Nakaseomyces glabratus]KAH7608852.1 Mitochondrial ribosomal subunit S27 [Nakaseomyces glabratus]KAH7609100.1 Mitochondrial ribosomal subunit S27 [Nakaseomyces glabratus]|eukprot:XP_445068.1 mitochondrial 37S ribosomal protein RSM27 [[Candida] glabrata]
MSIPKSRLLAVAELSAKIFDQGFNPSGARTGAKILSQRLKGPAVSSYYGNPDFVKFRTIRKLYSDIPMSDPEEDYRLMMVSARKRRGKGAPKKTKKSEAGEKSKKKK